MGDLESALAMVLATHQSQLTQLREQAARNESRAETLREATMQLRKLLACTDPLALPAAASSTPLPPPAARDGSSDLRQAQPGDPVLGKLTPEDVAEEFTEFFAPPVRKHRKEVHPRALRANASASAQSPAATREEAPSQPPAGTPKEFWSLSFR
jgi:hypothetical protein